MGAPKAAETPAAAPALTKSRFSASFRKAHRNLLDCRKGSEGDEPWLMPAATTAPEWIIGPSLPTQSPPATLNVTPTVLQMSVLSRTTRGILMPLR